jgi:hypothetical protein
MGRKGVFVLALAGGLALPAAAGAQERWLADLAVTMTATEDPGAGTIKHVIRVTNQGDDAARDVGITHIPVIGTAILSHSSTSAACAPRSYNNGSVWAIHCTLPVLALGATEKVVVVTGNATAWEGLKVTTAQAMGTSPEASGADNVAEVRFP